MALGDTGVTEQDHGWTGRHWDRTGRCRDGTEAGLGRSGESLGDTGVIQWDWGWTDRHREELGRHWGLSPRSHWGPDVPGGSLREGAAPASAHALCEGRRLRAGVCGERDGGWGSTPDPLPPPKKKLPNPPLHIPPHSRDGAICSPGGGEERPVGREGRRKRRVVSLRGDMGGGQSRCRAAHVIRRCIAPPPFSRGKIRVGDVTVGGRKLGAGRGAGVDGRCSPRLRGGVLEDTHLH